MFLCVIDSSGEDADTEINDVTTINGELPSSKTYNVIIAGILY